MQSECSRCCSLALTVLLLLSSSTAPRAQDATTSPPLPPPGRLVDVGGWRLHLNCAGKARTSQPIVIHACRTLIWRSVGALVPIEVSRGCRERSAGRRGSRQSMAQDAGQRIGPFVRPRDREADPWGEDVGPAPLQRYSRTVRDND